MSEAIEAIQGEFRRFTADEIGGVIRTLRDQRGLKRAALAVDSHVSEKTIERAESGEGINEVSCRRIAVALGLKEDAFTREQFIPTAEEAQRAQESLAQQRQKTHSPVSVWELRSVRDVLPLFSACALIGDDSCVADVHLHEFAQLKQSLLDWADISRDISETERIGAAEDILRETREFQSRGYIVKSGIAKHYLTTKGQQTAPCKFSYSLLVAFPKHKGVRDTSPSEVWFPKKMRPEF